MAIKNSKMNFEDLPSRNVHCGRLMTVKLIRSTLIQIIFNYSSFKEYLRIDKIPSNSLKNPLKIHKNPLQNLLQVLKNPQKSQRILNILQIRWDSMKLLKESLEKPKESFKNPEESLLILTML